MVHRAIDHHEIAGFEQENVILYLAASMAPVQVDQFEAVVPIGTDAVAPVQGVENHVHWQYRVKGPRVDSFGVDLRIEKSESVRPSDPWHQCLPPFPRRICHSKVGDIFANQAETPFQA
jgi:hypothetical protein